MPSLPEIFETKEKRDLFVHECAALVQAEDASLEEIKSLFFRVLKSLKVLCQTIPNHETIDDAVKIIAAEFHNACADLSQMSHFRETMDVLVRAVQIDVEYFLSDGRVVGDQENGNRNSLSKEQMERLRLEEEAAAIQKKKDKEEHERREKERIEQEVFREREKELLKLRALQRSSNDEERPEILNRDPRFRILTRPASEVLNPSAPVPTKEMPYRRKSAADLMREMNQLKEEKSKSKRKDFPTVVETEPTQAKNTTRHFFVETTVRLPTKCKFCREHIFFGEALKCDNCKFVIHTDCNNVYYLTRNGCLNVLN